MEILQMIGLGLILWLVAGFIVGLLIVTDSKFDRDNKKIWDKSEISDFIDYPKNPKGFILAAITLFGFISLFYFMIAMFKRMGRK